jgi:hypothetical protein
MMLMRTSLVVLCLTLVPATSAAQPYARSLSPLPSAAQPHAPLDEPARLIVSENAITDALTATQPPRANQRDSVRNGAIIGAAIGAVVMAGYAAYACHSLRDFDDPGSSCLPGGLLATWMGAVAGGFSGAGIDALFSTQPGRRVVVQFSLRK